MRITGRFSFFESERAGGRGRFRGKLRVSERKLPFPLVVAKAKQDGCCHYQTLDNSNGNLNAVGFKASKTTV